MPLTPFHLGPAFFFGLLLFPILYMPSFILGNVVVDVEPFLILLLNLNYPLHGFLHSFAGGSIVAVALAVLLFMVRDPVKRIMSVFRLQQDFSFRSILLSSLLGVYAHILLDAPLYADIKPFYPVEINPLYTQSVFIGFDIMSACVIMFLLSLVIYAYRLIEKH